MNTSIRLFLLLLVLLVPCLRVQAQIAVVTSKNGPDALTLAQLGQLYTGKATQLPGGKAVVLGEYAPLSDAFFQAAAKMNTRAVRKLWMSLVLSGGTGSPPVQLGSADAVKGFVAQNAGALAFLDLKDADASVKVVAIDGRKPGAPGYPLQP